MPDLGIYFDTRAETDTVKAADRMQRLLAPREGDYRTARYCDEHIAAVNVLKPFSFRPDQPVQGTGGWMMLDGALFGSEDSADHLMKEPDSLDAEGLRLLNGQFNLVFYSQKHKRLDLVTDRFGSRPLYHWTRGSVHLITSELKALAASEDFSFTYFPPGLLELFAFGHNVSDRTVLKGVKVLPPGCSIRIDEGGYRVQAYYRYRYQAREERASTAILGERIAQKVKEVVPSCLEGSGRKGIFLSGGLDSRIVAAGMDGREVTPTAFTFGYPEARDVKYAGLLAGLLGFKHRTLTYPSVYLSRVIRDVVSRTECAAPFHHATSILFHDAIAEEADKIIVGFCGDVFSGGHLRPGMFRSPPMPALVGMIFERALCCDPKMLARLFQPEMFTRDWRRMVEAFRESVESIEDQSPPDRADVWDVENRQRRFTFSAPKVDRLRFEVLAPLVDNRIADVFLSLPARARKGQRAYKHAIASGFPRFAGVPWAATGKPLELNPFKERAKDLVRLGMKAGGRILTRLGIGSPRLGWQFRDVGEEMRRDRDLLERHLYPFIHGERFMEGIFNRRGILDLVEEHKSGRADATHLLSSLLTVAVFTELWSEWERIARPTDGGMG